MFTRRPFPSPCEWCCEPTLEPCRTPCYSGRTPKSHRSRLSFLLQSLPYNVTSWSGPTPYRPLSDVEEPVVTEGTTLPVTVPSAVARPCLAHCREPPNRRRRPRLTSTRRTDVGPSSFIVTFHSTPHVPHGSPQSGTPPLRRRIGSRIWS